MSTATRPIHATLTAAVSLLIISLRTPTTPLRSTLSRR